MARKAILTIVLLACLCPSAWAATPYYVEIQLSDADTGNPVKDALITFHVDRGTLTRDPAADEHRGKPGFYYANLSLWDDEKSVTYAVTITCTDYEKRTHFLTINRGDPTNKKLDLRIKRSLTKGQWIDVMVMSSEDNQPIGDASVSVGPEGDKTEDRPGERKGMVSLHVTSPGTGQKHTLSVSQGNYRPFSMSIIVQIYGDERRQEYTCCLKPRQISTAPDSNCTKGRLANCSGVTAQDKTKLVITVVDRGLPTARIDVDKRLPVPGASVTVIKASGDASAPTGGDGKVEFELDPQRDRNRDLTVTVNKGDKEYYPGMLPINAADVPTTPTILEKTIGLDRYDTVKETTDQETGKVGTACGEIQGACTALSNAKDMRDRYFREKDKLIAWIQSFDRKVGDASRECLSAPSLRAEIQGLAGTVNTRAAILKTRLQAVEARAAACATKADAQTLKSQWQELVTLSWEVHNKATEAFEKQAKLKGIITQANAVKARFDRDDPSDQPVSVSLAGLPGKFSELHQSFKNEVNTVFQPAFNTVKAKRAACMSASNSAIGKIDALNVRNDSRIPEFKKKLKNLVPPAKNPCDEDDIKNKMDRDVNDIRQYIQAATDRVNELRAKPLCAGQSTADDLIAQINASQAVLNDLRASTIPQKIQQCEGRAAIAPPPKPQAMKVSISGPTTAKVGDTVTLTAQPGGSYYRYDWLVNNQASKQKQGDNRLIVPLIKETPQNTPHLFVLKVTDSRTNTYLGEASHRLRVEKKAQTMSDVPVTCSPSPSAAFGSNVTCRAKMTDTAKAELDRIYAGGWGYHWYVNETGLPSTWETASFRMPDRDASVVVKIVRSTSAQQLQELGKGATTVKVTGVTTGKECWVAKPEILKNGNRITAGESSLTWTEQDDKGNSYSNTMNWKGPPQRLCRGDRVTISLTATSNEGASVIGWWNVKYCAKDGQGNASAGSQKTAKSSSPHSGSATFTFDPTRDDPYIQVSAGHDPGVHWVLVTWPYKKEK